MAKPRVELPADAPKALRAAGLETRRRGAGLGVFVAVKSRSREFLVLTPSPDGTWFATLPRARRDSSKWSREDARRWDGRLEAILRHAEQEQLVLRARAVAGPLAELREEIEVALRTTKGKRQRGRHRPEVTLYEQLLERRRGPLQAGSPGLKQQKR